MFFSSKKASQFYFIRCLASKQSRRFFESVSRERKKINNVNYRMCQSFLRKEINIEVLLKLCVEKESEGKKLLLTFDCFFNFYQKVNSVVRIYIE